MKHEIPSSEHAELLNFTCQLINEQSISPNPANCLNIIQEFCHSIGCQSQHFDHNHTSNIFITSHPVKHFSFLFCGHIDVVPAGESKLWTSPPFKASIRNQILYGRGACDMKSSVASILMALKRYMHNPLNTTPIAMLFTSDEEGLAQDGTRFAMQQLDEQGYTFQQALVGEPTSQGNLGDTIKTGRRGSLTGSIEIRGKQAHVAYAKSSENPIFALANFIHNGCAHQWDSGHEHFPATQFCVTQVETPSNASNVTPSFAKCNLNFRYNPASSSDSLKAQVNELLDAENLPYNCSWNPASEPFYKKPGQFSNLVQNAIYQTCSTTAQLSTNGGTSDARFVSQYVDEIVEFGPLNSSAHAIDEHIPLQDLYRLYLIYTHILVSVHSESKYNKIT
ncbi:MAG: succinyl-diaminopimelate desuccinylase [Pseudomonadota bacterium]|nr:succinyl-diaminopimelate desuccinylase [Pseudomonadota bacterium]